MRIIKELKYQVWKYLEERKEYKQWEETVETYIREQKAERERVMRKRYNEYHDIPKNN